MKQTPLNDLHRRLGAKMTAFAGWELPVSYPEGLMAEHRACREGAALFDVSHMGQIDLLGEDPAAALERLVPGGIATLAEGRARYTQLTTEAGGILDDLIVTRTGEGLFLVVNAAAVEGDTRHLVRHLGEAAVRPREGRALLAVQGPRAREIVAGLVPEAEALGFMHSAAARWEAAELRLSCMGYTGEDGFEISLPAAAAEAFAEAVLAAGARPAGLGARDSLRLEAGLPLAGADIGPDTSPVEAGLAWSIPKRRRAEGGFPGEARIRAELEQGPARRLVGIRPAGRAPARAGTRILSETGAEIGHVTSGGFGPTVGAPVSMGYVAAEHGAPGTPVALEIRGKAHPGEVSVLPFVAHRYKR